MPRLQVYLPDDLFDQVKARGLPASALLQTAVSAELRRLDLEAGADQYLHELIADVGEPSEQEQDRADAIARRVQARAALQAG